MDITNLPMEQSPEWRRQVERGAGWLLGQPEGRVGVLGTGLSCFLGVLACWRLGRCAVVAPPELLPEVRERMLREAGCSVYLDGQESEAELPSPPQGDFEALVSYSSGTTGLPRGTIHSRSAIEARSVAMGGSLGLNREDVALVPDLDRAVAWYWFVLPLLTLGGKIVQTGSSDATWVTASPGTASLWLRQQKPILRARWALGGDAASPSLLKALEHCSGYPPVMRYGLTELGGVLVDGHPLPGVETRLVDGELHVRTPWPMTSYLDGTVPFDQDGWYATGDLFERTPEDLFLFRGRKKDILSRGGIKVAPRLVEEALEAFPGVRRAVAVGVPTPDRIDRIVAYLEGEADLDALLHFAQANLHPLAVPDRLVTLHYLPTGPGGKPDRNTLRHRAEEEDRTMSP